MSDIHHPIFPNGERVAVVERVDRPGMLAVARVGARFVCPLPAGYDQYTQVRWVNGYIIVTHPKFPPVLADVNTGKIVPITADAAAAAIADYEPPKGLIH